MYMALRYGLILVLIVSAGGWFSADARQVTDMDGRQVIVPDVIRKVYSTSPPATYLLYALDPELLAGLNFPFQESQRRFVAPRVKQLPVIGGWFGQGQTPNLETLLQVKPDIILVWLTHDSATGRKIEETLAPLGFPVVRITLETVADTAPALRFLGTLLDREKRAAALSGYADQSLAEIRSVRNALAPSEKISVYYAEGPDGLGTECNDSSHAELIPLCGGNNVHQCLTKNLYGMEKISPEQVIRYAPQVIVMHDPLFYDTVFTDPRWQNVRAVRDRRVYKIPSLPFNWFDRPPCFMRLLGAKWLLRHLYPQRYPIDMVAETQRFYQLFLNVTLDIQAARELLAP